MSKAATAVGRPRKPEGFNPIDLTKFSVNTPEDVIVRNVEKNIRRHLPQLDVYDPQDTPICIVGGGWSLDDTFGELRDLVWGGVPVMALNGAGNWLAERNIRPNIVMVLDARAHNVAFVEKPVPGCKYFLASQCDPSVFDACEGRDVYIYHVVSTADEKPFKDMLTKYYRTHCGWRNVIGGSTVGMRAIVMARILGWQLQHLFGIDSCHAPDGRNHAYKQDWQDGEPSFRMWCAGREFKCSAWQASQAHNFMGQVKIQGNQFHLTIHGDGLLAHITKTGAEAKLLGKD